jgi:hypothetical protein
MSENLTRYKLIHVCRYTASYNSNRWASKNIIIKRKKWTNRNPYTKSYIN